MRILRRSEIGLNQPIAAKRGISPSHPLDVFASDSRVLALEQDGLAARLIRSVQTETARETGPFRFVGTAWCGELSTHGDGNSPTASMSQFAKGCSNRRIADHRKTRDLPFAPIDAAVSDARVIALEQDGLAARSVRSVQTETARETGPFRFWGSRCRRRPVLPQIAETVVDMALTSLLRGVACSLLEQGKPCS